MEPLPKINYRRDYELYLGVPFDRGIHVHHIDHDQSNNDIENLVAIPASLHSRYHFLERIRQRHSYILKYRRPQKRALEKYNIASYANGSWRSKFSGSEEKYFQKIEALRILTIYYEEYDEANRKYLSVRNQILSIKCKQKHLRHISC